MLPIMIYSDRVQIGERFSVSFQRTLRIPDDDQVYPLPPSLGSFPIQRVRDYASQVPTTWNVEDSIFIPMYQREALWLGFRAAAWKPNAVMVAIGRINAISGEVWDEHLHSHPQNYVVCPDQPWLDGINAGDGVIRQFVAMPLGQGLTVEAQLSGVEHFGGMHIRVFEPKPGIFPEQPLVMHSAVPEMLRAAAPIGEMGLGAGGRMRQKIYPDPYGSSTWDPHTYGELSVYLVNSAQYQRFTGLEPPPTPIAAHTYTNAGLPWFDLYDEARGDVAATTRLAAVRSIRSQETEQQGAPHDEPSLNIRDAQIHRLHHDHQPSRPASNNNHDVPDTNR